MASTQPITTAEKDLAQTASNFNKQPLPLCEEVETLYKVSILPHNTTWYAYQHHCQAKEEWQKIAKTFLLDKMQNVFVFQKKNVGVVIHTCVKPNAIKCKCEHYSLLLPPRDPKVRNNPNILKAMSTFELLREIIQVFVEQSNDDLDHHCGAKIVMLNGTKFSPDVLPRHCPVS